MRRKQHRADTNQGDIIKALRAMGATVASLSQVGDGVPDLLVGFQARNWLLEVKRDEKQKLNERQAAFFKQWEGQAVVVCSPMEALIAIGAVNPEGG